MEAADYSSLRIRSASRSIALGMLLITASLVLVKTGRDALYVQQRGIFDLPIAYVGMAVFSFPTALGMLWLIRVRAHAVRESSRYWASAASSYAAKATLIRSTRDRTVLVAR